MKKKVWQVLGIILVALILCGCGEKGYENSKSAEPAAAYKREYSYDSEYATLAAGNYAASMDYAAGYSEEVYADTYAFTESTSGNNAGSAAKEPAQEKIIYSADATVETTEFEATIEALQNMIESRGGWIESSSVNGAKYSNISKGVKTNRSANYTLRVAQEHFSDIMGSLSNLGNVPYSHVYTENVTSQYYDTQARLRTYEAQEQRLIELLGQAEDVSDVIEIERELTDVRYRIESQQTSLNNWDRRVSWSTIYLTVNEVSEYTPAKKLSYGGRLWNALKSGMEDLGDFFIDFIEALPTLIVIAAIAVVLFRGVKAGIRWKRKKRSENKTEK